MALTRPFPIDQAYPNAVDLRKQESAVFPREGIFPDPINVNPAAAAAGVAGIAYPNGGWNVGANPFVANIKRGAAPFTQAYGSAHISNDAAGTAWTITPAPASGTRVDRLWIRATDPGQGEATSGSDGPGGVARAVPVYGKTDGTPAIQPLPAGAVEIAQVSTPSTATSIAQSTITQTFPYANVLGGPVFCRNDTERTAVGATLAGGETLYQMDTKTMYRMAFPPTATLVPESSGWVDFTPAWVTAPTLGTGGVILYAKCRFVNGNQQVRVGLRFGTGTVVLPDLQLVPPFAVATWLSSSVTPVGFATYIDSSAGANGRFMGPVYNTSSGLRCNYGMGPMGLVSGGSPFTAASSDEVHISAEYPV